MLRCGRPSVALLVLFALLALVALETPGALAAPPASPDLQSERTEVSEWRARRVEALTNDSGWLTLAGLFWLKEGENSFGRAPDNALALDNPALAEHCGTFSVSDRTVRFTAAAGSAVTAAGRPVSSLELTPDAGGQPTVLATGTLRFYLIERAGNLGVRVRDLNNPHRTGFRGLSYFPVSTDWVFDARFEPYEPAHHIRIINILGMEQQYASPGAVVFAKDGREWRLETVLEEPGDQELFIMFADATSGHETYGGGRFLYVALPSAGRTRVDFNKAYNPPCALNDFATCPLPPPQNRLGLRIEAGEKTYAGGHGAEPARRAISRAGAATARDASAP
jgi:uncharacterized protein (DUF1684 family)